MSTAPVSHDTPIYFIIIALFCCELIIFSFKHFGLKTILLVKNDLLILPIVSFSTLYYSNGINGIHTSKVGLLDGDNIRQTDAQVVRLRTACHMY